MPIVEGTLVRFLIRIGEHRQVADAYLAGLAGARGGLLATFDEALANTLPDQVGLIPPMPQSRR